jgi:hypothetical protein
MIMRTRRGPQEDSVGSWDQVKSQLNMIKNKLALKIEGDKISYSKFQIAINSFFRLIDEISANITQKRKPILWDIDVAQGSISLFLCPEAKIEDFPFLPKILTTIEHGINSINERDERPDNFTDKALEEIRNLAKIIDPPSSRGIRSIRVFVNGNKTDITTKAIGNIDSILQIRREEMGSFEGRLEVISARRGFHFIVYEFVKNRPIICNFKQELIEKILSAFGKRVYVFGLVRYRKGGIPYSIQVEKLRILHSKDEFLPSKNVLGILKDTN